MATALNGLNGHHQAAKGAAGVAALVSYRALDKLGVEELRRLQRMAGDVIHDKTSQLDLWLSPADIASVEAAAQGGVDPVTETRPAAQADNQELAAVLSPSQVNCWMNCQASWYFKYFLKLEAATTPSQALGRAIHEAMECYFIQKLVTPADPLPESDTVQAFRDAWIREAGKVEFDAGENADELADKGEEIVRLLWRDWCPTIQPAAVEQRVEGLIGGVRVQGYIDLIDVHGRVIDLKTAAKTPGQWPSAPYAFQVSTYQQLGAATGARLTTAVKTKVPKIVQQDVVCDSKARAMTERLYPLAQEQMRAGYYFPNRQSHFCSRKQCGYWRECEQEFGGRVPGAEVAE
jgi:hypothetical protein